MSTKTNSEYLRLNANRLHEIDWLKAKIISLEQKYKKRPSTIKEIRDLERQIRERGGEPDTHEWITEKVNG
jgi:hypothetical protein